MKPLFVLAVCGCLFFHSRPVLQAQTVQGRAFQGQALDPAAAESAKFRWGPLRLTPRIALTDLGVDTNVRNSAGEPSRDITATTRSGADTWLRFGRAQLSLRTSLDWTYFHQFREQRSLGFSEDGRIDLLLNRVTPYAIGAYLTTRQRPNLEIDERVRQKSEVFGAGSGIRVGSRTLIELGAVQSRVDFDEERFGNAEVAHALNRRTREANVSFRTSLTPLTTFFVQAKGSQDRFESALRRDSNSVMVVPGFQLKPLALIAGRASVGYRNFNVRDKEVPDFSGIVASTDLSYIIREMTRVGFIFQRDVDYSVDDAQPYLVVTQSSVSLTQVIALDWYVAGRVERSWLDYRGVPSGATGPEGRHDRVSGYGLGIARRLGTDLRVGFNVDRVNRKSILADRNYDGYKVGGSITYGNGN